MLAAWAYGFAPPAALWAPLLPSALPRWKKAREQAF